MTDQLEAAWAARVACPCGYDCIDPYGKATFMAGYAAARADAEARIEALEGVVKAAVETIGREGAVTFGTQAGRGLLAAHNVARAALADPPAEEVKS